MDSIAAHHGSNRYGLSSRIDHDLQAIIDRAEDGDPAAAQETLARFVQGYLNAEQIDPRVYAYLAKAFGAMLDAGARDPRHQLGLLRRRAGNPKIVTEKRPATLDDHAERQQEVYESIGAGLSDADAIRNVCAEPLVPARMLGGDVASGMARKAKRMLPRKRELLALGVPGYEVPKLIAMQFDTDARTVERVLYRLELREGRNN